jgi:hypothetical protein
MNIPLSVEELLEKHKEDKEDDIEYINGLFEKFEKKIERIEGKLDKIIKIFEKDIEENCRKMSGHIDFVESVYTTVKSPLSYICSKVNHLTGGSNEDLVLTDISYNNNNITL